MLKFYILISFLLISPFSASEVLSITNDISSAVYINGEEPTRVEIAPGTIFARISNDRHEVLYTERAAISNVWASSSAPFVGEGDIVSGSSPFLQVVTIDGADDFVFLDMQ